VGASKQLITISLQVQRNPNEEFNITIKPEAEAPMPGAACRARRLDDGWPHGTLDLCPIIT